MTCSVVRTADQSGKRTLVQPPAYRALGAGMLTEGAPFGGRSAFSQAVAVLMAATSIAPIFSIPIADFRLMTRPFVLPRMQGGFDRSR